MTSATGNSRQILLSRQRGLTLLEILLVVLIIGLLSTVAVLTLPSDNGQRDVRTMAERMVSLFRYARQEAVFSGVTHGIVWRQGRPELLRRGAEGWDSVPDRRLASLQEKATQFPMFLETGSQRLDLSQDYEAPQILFTNDGQVSPFQLLITHREREAEFTVTDTLTLEPQA
ncbi:general secretion pathway protein H [Litorivivens lipolytica]|uniref:Type II secretion system protein H n=1 Tax=Litorivivens lipolytica TaxID=1524264 RepID=A0A7W4W607_9GAMM|nr:general secretion pathway protein H [Litorivivens lipolytica]